jgi:peptide/nickel transport system permease protein
VLSFTLRRLAASALLLLVVLSVTFFLVHLAPGEPAELFADPRISEEHRDRIRRFYGLDRPLHEQYLIWIGATVRGDWGISYSTGRPVSEVLLERLPNTLILVAGTAAVEYGLGLVFGLLAAVGAGGRLDRGIRVLSLLFYTLPSFWLALLAIELLSVHWQLFPAGQMTSEGADRLPLLARWLDLLHHLVLPALALGIVRCGGVIRFVRNGLLDVLGQDYVRTARAKGLHPLRVLCVHALPNALLPLIQRLGVGLPALVGGMMIIEVIFSWPGLGQTGYRAVLQRDYPLVLATTALSGVLVVLGNLVADLLQAWLDPRVRHG